MLVCHKNDGKDGDDDDGADYDDVDDGRKLHGLRTRAPVVLGSVFVGGFFAVVVASAKPP